MHIQIEVPRASTVICLIATISSISWVVDQIPTHALSASIVPQEVEHVHTEEQGTGGDGLSMQQQVMAAEEKIRDGRNTQALLQKKEQLLRYQLGVLKMERDAMGNRVSPQAEEEFRTSTVLLTSLLQDEARAEQFLLEAFNELWDAEGRVTALDESFKGDRTALLALSWPVKPELGISAYFHDAAYKARFGMEHNAVDIPVNQGSIVLAAADGVVKDVVDNGLGFNYITIQHENGAVTLYGHLSGFLVEPGEKVFAGTAIGRSGGRPGTQGAGFSTGPHLHFGLRINGATVDPLEYLPKEVLEEMQAKLEE
jgi:murein DD-endopeptidase MepM/ murein hydrolase activator NlpD